MPKEQRLMVTELGSNNRPSRHHFLLTFTFLFLGLLTYFKYFYPFCNVWIHPKCGSVLFHKSSVGCVSGHYQARTHCRPPPVSSPGFRFVRLELSAASWHPSPAPSSQLSPINSSQRATLSAPGEPGMCVSLLRPTCVCTLLVDSEPGRYCLLHP